MLDFYEYNINSVLGKFQKLNSNVLSNEEQQQLDLINKILTDTSLIHSFLQNEDDKQMLVNIFNKINNNENLNNIEEKNELLNNDNIIGSILYEQQQNEIIQQVKLVQGQIQDFIHNLTSNSIQLIKQQLPQQPNKNKQQNFVNENFINQSNFSLSTFTAKQQTVIQQNYDINNLLTLSECEFACVGISNEISIWKIGQINPIQQFFHETCDNELFALEKFDEKTLAVGGGGDYSIKIFNWRTGENLQTYKAHTSRVQTILKLRKQNQFLSAGEDNAIIVWDINSGQVLKNIQQAHSNYIYCCICVNENQVISSGRDNKLKIWNSENWSLIKDETVNGGEEINFILQLNEFEIAVSGDDGKIRIYSIPNLQCTKSIQVHNNNCSIYKLILLSENTLVSAGCEDKQVKIIDWKQQICLLEKTLNCNGYICCGLCSVGKNYILTGSQDKNEIIVWI